MEHLVKELDIDWDTDTLIDLMMSSSKSQWVIEEGISNRYLRLQHTYIDGLYDSLKSIGYNPRNSFFAEMRPGTQLPVHTDFARANAVNFPLVGDWNRSPLMFYGADRQTPIYTYHYKKSQAVWINTQVPHTVANDSSSNRYILSISLY